MKNAMTGDAASSSSGKTTAKAKIWTAAVRLTAMRGEANSTTGSKVIADIDHSGSSSARAAIAASAARISGAAKAIRIVRRSAAFGHSVSLIAARLGRVARAPSAIGTAI